MHFRLPDLRSWLIALGLVVLFGTTCSAEHFKLSTEERLWLDAHPIIRLGVDTGYGPYTFLDAEGQLQGIAAEFISDIERLLDIRFEIVDDLSWPQLMEAVRTRHLDVVATVVKLPERESFLEFSSSYLTTPLVVMTRSATGQLNSLDELRKLRLALVEGYASSKQLLARFPALQPNYVTTPLEGLRQVASGAADAYVGVLGVNSFLAARHGITNLKVNAAFDMQANNQGFGVRKDWPQLAQLLDKALAAIPAERKNSIFQHWLPKQLGEIERLSGPSYITRLFPWLLSGLGLSLLAYLVVLMWNRQLKKELTLRSAALERAQAIAHIGDWTMEIETGRIQWSDELYRIAGRDQQSVRLDWPTLREWIHPDEHEQHEQFLQQVKNATPEDKLPLLTSHLIRPDGESRWLEISTKVEFDNEGKPLSLYGTAQDITERKRAEEQRRESETLLRALVANLPDLVWLKDPEGVYLTCNPKFEHFFDATRAEIIGKTDYDFVDLEMAESFREKDRAVIAAKKPLMFEEDVVFAADGHREQLETVKAPMFDSDGTLIGVLGVGRDISARKQTEQALRRSQKMDAIGQLTGGIAHDFNNILAIILGATELLERQIAPQDKAHKRVETIKRSARRASELTQQLLGFSYNQAAHLAVTDLNREIAGMENLIARSITPQIEVDLQLSDNLWWTEIDPGDFQDALLNLILNARDAMPGGGQLTIETDNCVLDEPYCTLNPDVIPGEYVQLAVSDSGTGMEYQVQERIFEPFFTTKVTGKGTGLGLAMVYGFVKRSGGTIKVYSEPQIGTTFRLYLPRTLKAESLNVPPAELSDSLPRGHETLLVVDDEVELLNLAQDFLESLGYRVLSAVNGRQALEILAKEPHIDLLFTDVVMPGGINGYELAEQATAHNPALKVLLNSGFTERAVAHNGQARFNANLLSKPYSQAVMAHRVRLLLDESDKG